MLLSGLRKVRKIVGVTNDVRKIVGVGPDANGDHIRRLVDSDSDVHGTMGMGTYRLQSAPQRRHTPGR